MSTDFEAQIIAREAHIDLFNRFGFALDQRNWTAFAALFTEDAGFTTTVGHGFDDNGALNPGEVLVNARGRDDVVATIASFIESVSATHHLMSNYVVDIAEDRKSAKASAYARVYHIGKGPKAALFEESFARFDIKTVYQQSAWKIASMDELVMIMLGTVDVFG